MQGGFRPVTGRSHESAAERAYEHVKARLLDGRFAEGTLLSENEIARRLGISRTPVRQAFLQLEGEELLELYPRRGALVRPIRSTEDAEVLEARLLVENHCVGRVAAGPTRPGDALEECLRDQQDALAADDERAFIEADRAFHRVIVAAAGNAILERWYDALRDRQQRISASAVARDPARIRGFIDEHRAIAAAIADGDVARSQELVAAHLRSPRARPPALNLTPPGERAGAARAPTRP